MHTRNVLGPRCRRRASAGCEVPPTRSCTPEAHALTSYITTHQQNAKQPSNVMHRYDTMPARDQTVPMCRQPVGTRHAQPGWLQRGMWTLSATNTICCAPVTSKDVSGTRFPNVVAGISSQIKISNLLSTPWNPTGHPTHRLPGN